MKRTILLDFATFLTGRFRGGDSRKMTLKKLQSRVLVTFCLLAIAAFAEEPPKVPHSGTVSSTHAEYDGNALILNGHVILNHGLGKMNAEHASLEKQEAGKDFPFSFIHLEKEVFLHLKDNAKLFCEKADLDFITLKGNLYSKDNEKVTYTDLLNQTIPFKLLGKNITLEMSKLETDEKKNTYEIETVTAENAVTVHYNNDYILEAHRAHYRKNKQEQENTSEFSGFITATPKEDSDVCHLHHLGDLIDASKVEIDLIKETLILKDPIGRLVSSLVPHPENSEVRFESDELSWEQSQNTLSLHHNIHVQDSSLGKIDADDHLQLTQKKVEDKTVIQMISTQGKTRLEYIPHNQTTPQVLICHDSMLIDRDKLSAVLLSPEEKGRVLDEKQIYYEEERIASFADRARIDYAIVDSKITPVSLTMTHNIRLFSHLPDAPQRCSLADRLTYSPETHTLILSADPGKRVLFWDEGQSLCIAAQEIHIIQDSKTKEESIKGVGNVKFAFTSQESELLQDIFPFYKREAPHHE